jgi:hypothetical protein
MKITTFLLLFLIPASAMSQSLADVARKEEARRKTVKGTAKVYTNEDLVNTRDVLSAPAPAPASPAAGGSAKPSAAATPPSTGNTESSPESKDPQFWKGRMAAAQDALNRNKVLLAALEARVNSLNADLLNAADQFQRNKVEESLKTATGELARVKLDIASATKAVNDIEEEARKANVPPGWLR